MQAKDLASYDFGYCLVFLLKLVNLSHLAYQIHSKIFTQLWLAKSLAWQILAANLSSP
jgi:hypothetical protein